MTAQQLVDGPGWAPRSLQPYAGLYPLAVEGHVSRMVSVLVPGVTTVTIHARYYAIHTAVALHAHRAELDWDSTQQLLRKAEVIAALATMASPEDIDDVGYPHGYGRLLPALEVSTFDLDELSAPGTGYSNNERGFLGVYLGSELETGMVDSATLQPGRRATSLELEGPLANLLDLAATSVLNSDQLRTAAVELSLARTAEAPDGTWLRQIICASNLDEPSVTDRTRRATTRILLRSIQNHPDLPPEGAFRHHVAFGDAITDDPVLVDHDESATWRGTLLRSYSANAWRQLWAWLVNQIDDLTPPETLADWLADALPDGTVGDFIDDVPDTQAGSTSLPAESAIDGRRDLNTATRALQVLVAGARRTQELDEPTLKAFVGPRRTMLDPIWVHDRLEANQHQPLRDFATDLTWDLLDRADRVSLRKSRLVGGQLRIPTRLREKRGLYWMDGTEGSGPVGLRIPQLARILTTIGVIENTETGRAPTATALELLDLPPAP